MSLLLRAGLLLLALSVSPALAQDVRRVEAIPETPVVALAADGDVLYAATDTEVYVSPDAGATWQAAAPLPDGATTLNTLFAHDGILYVGSYSDGVYATADRGVTWLARNTGLAGDARLIQAFARRGATLYAGTAGAGVYRLDLDDPTGWQPFNSGLFRVGVEALAAGGDHLVASVGAYLFVQPPTGDDWVFAPWDEQQSQRDVLEILPTEAYLFIGTTRDLYRGTPTAQNLQRVGIDLLPGLPVRALGVQGNRLYAGVVQNFGEYFLCTSDDQGLTWEVRAHEFADLYDLMIVGTDLWAARSDGLWVHDGLATGTERPRPAPFRLAPNHPNPFDGATTLAFDLAAPGPVWLSVYDALGREVRYLLDGAWLPAGLHRIAFDGAGLPAGSYLYRLRTAHGTAMGLMTRLR